MKKARSNTICLRGLRAFRSLNIFLFGALLHLPTARRRAAVDPRNRLPTKSLALIFLLARRLLEHFVTLEIEESVDHNDLSVMHQIVRRTFRYGTDSKIGLSPIERELNARNVPMTSSHYGTREKSLKWLSANSALLQILVVLPLVQSLHRKLSYGNLIGYEAS